MYQQRPCTEVRFENANMKTETYGYSNGELLSTNRSLTSISIPDMDAEKRQRRLRTQRAMEAVNPFLAHKLLPKAKRPSREEKAAIDIQRVFRGFLARRNRNELMFEKFLEEEAEMEARRRAQVEEGELLVHSYQLEREVEELSTVRRNKERFDVSHAVTIQRAWRAHQRRKTEDGDVDYEYEPLDIGQAEFGYNEQEFPITPYDKTYRTLHLNRNDEFDDSLEDNFVDSEDYLYDNRRGHSNPVFLGGFLSNSSFNEHLVREGIRNFTLETQDSTSSSIQESLPSPTTDWDTIESVLQTESGINSPEDGTDGEESDITSKLNRTGPALQMCFVDDNDSSVTDNDSDPEVKVYIVDDERTLDYLDKAQPLTDLSGTSVNILHELDRDLDSRDSGYVPGDLVDLNIERVTDLNSKRMKTAPPPEEESTRVLTALEIHGRHEEQQKEKDVRKRKMLNDMEMKSMEELLRIKSDLESKIQDISDQLVTELMTRDTLHAEQDSLVMDVEDLTKLAQEKQKVQGIHGQTKTKIK